MTSQLLPLLMRLSYIESDLKALGDLHNDDTAQLIARQARVHLQAIRQDLEAVEFEQQAQQLEVAMDAAIAACRDDQHELFAA